MEVETGAIKAIANLGRRANGSYAEIYNYAIGRRTEPGSTFKAAAMLAMLEDGLITPNDTVEVNNGHDMFYGRHMYDAGGWTKYKELPAWKVFSTSSNVGTAKLADKAYKHNKKKFYQKLEQFHLTEKTGVPLAGEATPLIKKYDDPNWSNTTIPWVSTGYEVEITPLQTLTFYNAIANGGKMIKPQLVEKVVDHGKEVKNFKVDVLDKRIASEKAIEQLTDMMKKVVEEGTARNIKSPYYTIAGKTGTSKIFDVERNEYVNRYRASFAGFFPAENPKYSCVVFIEEPSNGLTHGGSVAAPVFKEIADKIMAVDLEMLQPYNVKSDSANTYLVQTNFKSSVKTYKNLASKMNLKVEHYENANYLETIINDEGQVQVKPFDATNTSIPDLSGMALDEALFILENAGVKVSFKGKGKVKAQSILPGTNITQNMTIQLQLG